LTRPSNKPREHYYNQVKSEGEVTNPRQPSSSLSLGQVRNEEPRNEIYDDRTTNQNSADVLQEVSFVVFNFKPLKVKPLINNLHPTNYL